MSYEEISRESRPCRCGKGSIIAVEEMDDWNRFKSWQIVQCRTCLAEDKRLAEEEGIREGHKEAALTKAKKLAKKRHLVPWLKKFGGLSKKAVWLAITQQGKTYPSLGTFYTHVKHHDSVKDYLAWRFDQDFREMITNTGINDPEIEKLLRIADAD